MYFYIQGVGETEAENNQNGLGTSLFEKDSIYMNIKICFTPAHLKHEKKLSVLVNINLGFMQVDRKWKKKKTKKE